jgi:nicotinate phosphoribosyltransferase
MKKSIIPTLYKHNLTLLTDLYQLTMANGYWKNDMYNHEAVFHLFYRKNPFKNGFAIAAGLEQVISYLENLRFEVDDIRYLANLKGADGKALFDETFLNYLQRFKFDCDVDAIIEGTVVFPHEPLVRIKGNLIQAQLVETALLTMVNFQTLIATKAARIKKAAQNDSVLEFGLRRAQGIDGGLTASRAAYIGGCDGTSNVLAGKLFDIPVKGTHAHSWVMAFDNELSAFSAYANAMPNNCVFLVDTYDTIEGVKYAIEVGNKLKSAGKQLLGIRLDSGDLAALSIEARKILDAAGFEKTAIVASNDLDEYRIKTLKEKGAKITVWGVGTRLVTAFDQPALGGVYKLGAIKSQTETDWNYKIKLSENPIKVSNPGVLQVKRIYKNNQPIADAIFSETDFINDNSEIKNPIQQIIRFNNELIEVETLEQKNLLQPIFRQGKLVYELPNIHQIRKHTLSQIAIFNDDIINNYKIGLESNLNERKRQLIDRD